jgi:hypothetical protein
VNRDSLRPRSHRPRCSRRLPVAKPIRQDDVILNHVAKPLKAGEIARFDPQIETAKPYGVGYTELLRALVTRRESAWRQVELLVSTPHDSARADVAQPIEDAAAVNARAIATATSCLRRRTSTSARDQYCVDRSNEGN